MNVYVVLDRGKCVAVYESEWDAQTHVRLYAGHAVYEMTYVVRTLRTKFHA